MAYSFGNKMKRDTTRSLLTASIVGSLVTSYWLLAFFTALTTPLNFGNGHTPTDPWELIDPIRDSGLHIVWPLVFDDSHPLPAIRIFDHAPFEVQLAILAFYYGLAAMVVTLVPARVGFWLWSRRYLNEQASKTLIQRR
jgi:hypothetical protein